MASASYVRELAGAARSRGPLQKIIQAGVRIRIRVPGSGRDAIVAGLRPGVAARLVE